MKTVELFELERSIGPGDSLMRFSSKDYMKVAIQFNPDNLKGLDRIAEAAYLLKKISDAPDGQEILLEDKEFNLLKESIDKCQNFGVGILYFPEFIDSIRNAKSVEVTKK